MKIGDEVYVHGYVDEIRKDVVIVRNEGGYFGTVPNEVMLAIMRCKECKNFLRNYVDMTPPYGHDYCTKWSRYTSADGGCSYGERAEQTESQTEDLQDWKDRMWAEAVIASQTENE